ncbi:MAG TPA: ATP-binding protein [Polyangiaceae bacterium]|nr:ATP-binding protein [Polyangiaceae bacterium]
MKPPALPAPAPGSTPLVREGDPVNEVQALAEAVLEAARVAGLGVTVSFDDRVALRHIYVNDAAAQVMGASVEGLMGSETLLSFAPEERERIGDLLTRSRHGDLAPGLVETTVLRADGSRVPVELAFSLVPLSGEPAVVAFLRDTTDRKLLQSHLALRDRMASLGMLAASVAHEINNPLAYAALNLETIVRQLQSSRGGLEAEIAAARDGLQRVAAIVRDLQRLSLPNSTECWPVDVREVLDSALNVAMHALSSRARIERDYGEVPSLKTDPAKLGQIFLNLVFNAAESFEHTDPARNLIRLRVSTGDTGEVLVAVCDNGPGIPRDQLERVFEPFFTTKDRGMGLGLAISRTLAARLGGKLLAESEVGRGSTFALQLPAPASGERT